MVLHAIKNQLLTVNSFWRNVLTCNLTLYGQKVPGPLNIFCQWENNLDAPRYKPILNIYIYIYISCSCLYILCQIKCSLFSKEKWAICK
jgi:hypothetical protein